VWRLIAGPNGVYICNECIDLRQEIIAEEPNSAPEVHQPAEIEPADSETASGTETDSNVALLEVLGEILVAVRKQGEMQDRLGKLLQEALEKR
jgi:ATP-dependent protease Clp ATPase subunit